MSFLATTMHAVSTSKENRFKQKTILIGKDQQAANILSLAPVSEEGFVKAACFDKLVEVLDLQSRPAAYHHIAFKNTRSTKVKSEPSRNGPLILSTAVISTSHPFTTHSTQQNSVKPATADRISLSSKPVLLLNHTGVSTSLPHSISRSVDTTTLSLAASHLFIWLILGDVLGSYASCVM